MHDNLIKTKSSFFFFWNYALSLSLSLSHTHTPMGTHPSMIGLSVQGSGYQASGTGRARRDAAARAMQGWHVQRLFGYGEVGEPIIKVC